MENEISQQILNKLDCIQSEMTVIKQDIYDKLNHMNSRADNMDNRMDIMQQDIRNLQKDVAVIQQEHGEKIQLLLDYAVQNSEEHARMNTLLEKHSSTLDNHEIRLQIAEDKLAISL